MVFKEEIYVDRKRDIRWGTTDVPVNKTMNEIMDALDENDCDEVVTRKKGKKRQIGFVFENKKYLITIPRVYVNGRFKEEIGPRIVKYYLETVLGWNKERPLNIEDSMLPFRLIEIEGKEVPLRQLVEEIPDSETASILGSKITDAEELPSSQEEPKTTEAIIVEEE